MGIAIETVNFTKTPEWLTAVDKLGLKVAPSPICAQELTCGFISSQESYDELCTGGGKFL
jgi:type II secretory pathway component PulM